MHTTGPLILSAAEAILCFRGKSDMRNIIANWRGLDNLRPIEKLVTQNETNKEATEGIYLVKLEKKRW